MIKIDKIVTITISEDDVQTLSNICECARVYLDNNPKNAHWRRGERDVGQWGGKELFAIGHFMNNIFEV